jgi:hypothetical protein
MSDLTTEYLAPALRQYRHNADNSPQLSPPKEGFGFGYDKRETIRLVAQLQSQVSELEIVIRGDGSAWHSLCRAFTLQPPLAPAATPNRYTYREFPDCLNGYNAAAMTR